jgi:HAE1 family hydrophobic/amphiphilic exporter-1
VNLPELSIRRHVLTYMLSGLFLLFGTVSYFRIGTDRFPQIEFPLIVVRTLLPGADPETVDSSITNVIESAVNSAPGIEHVRSRSSSGVSITVINFLMEKDADVAFNEVQARVSQILPELPDDADPPVVTKAELGSVPIVWLTLTGDRTLQQLNQYARNVVKKRLETINGVGEVQLGGERERTIRVELDPQRMAAFGITATDVIRGLRAEHLRLPGGFLVGGSNEELVELDLEYHDPQALAELIVAYRDGAPIRIREIGAVADGLADNRQGALIDGEPTVAIGVLKVRNANTIDIVEEVKRRIEEEILPQLPPGMELRIVHDDGSYIEQIVDTLGEHVALGTLFTALVVFAFLKNLRSTLIVAAAIPVSLLGAVAVMYVAGFTFNMMTLLALLLLIGVVVDDAIVVLENIFRNREESEPDPVRAAIDGTNQVVFAVIASTLTLAAIFGSVLFITGITGQFFRAFAIVVSSGVLVSLFVALTLTPTLCARHLQVSRRHGRIYRLVDVPFRAMERGYRRLLALALRFRWTVLALTVTAVFASSFFFQQLGGTFFPEQDEGRFLITVKAPLGSSIDYMDAKVREVETIVRRQSEVTSVLTTIGSDPTGRVSQATMTVNMVPWEARDASQADLTERLRAALARIPGIETFATEMPISGGDRGEPLQFVVVGPELERVAEYAYVLRDRLALDPGMGDLDLDLQLDLPTVDFVLSRERIRSLGLSAEDVATTISVLASGRDVARYNDIPSDGERYDVRVKAAGDGLASPQELSRLYLRAESGELVRLDNVVATETGIGPAVVGRFDLQYSAFFYSSPIVSLGEAMEKVRRTAAEVLPLGYRITFVGRASEFAKTRGYMAFAFTAALVLVFMVLASQFNSFAQPLVIMVAQPLAIIGGAAALWLTGHSLNIFSMIGLTLLVGLVAKNSILLVDLTNQLRAQGRAIREALEQACPIRLRPVLMTSFTIVLALSPAALGAGAGSDLNAPLAVAVIGGMVSSTALTLVVVPAAYSLVEEGLARMAARRRRELPATTRA